MLASERWTKDGGYATELEDGRRAVLKELREAAKGERPGELERRVARVSQRLRALVGRKARSRAGMMLAGRAAKLLGLTDSAADYRGDAALGHFAGQAAIALENRTDAGSAAERSSRIAA
jgi:hypothetical protein